MAFLATHNSIAEIVGIDGVRQALDEFAATHGSDLDIVEVQEQNDDGYDRFQGKSITLLKGDFFDLKDVHTGGTFDAVWDRASIVAIDPSMREAYVATMSRLVKPGGSMLVSTLDRRTGTEEAMKSGPPFSIPEVELRRLYEGQDWVESVELLDEIDEFAANPDQKARYASSGVASLYELLFLVKAKA